MLFRMYEFNSIDIGTRTMSDPNGKGSVCGRRAGSSVGPVTCALIDAPDRTLAFPSAAARPRAGRVHTPL